MLTNGRAATHFAKSGSTRAASCNGRQGSVQFTITVQKTGSLGIDIANALDGATAIWIGQVKSGGIIDVYNRRVLSGEPRSPKVVMAGDLITQINGVKGSATKMDQLLVPRQDVRQLTMTIKRDAKPQAPEVYRTQAQSRSGGGALAKSPQGFANLGDTTQLRAAGYTLQQITKGFQHGSHLGAVCDWLWKNERPQQSCGEGHDGLWDNVNTVVGMGFQANTALEVFYSNPTLTVANAMPLLLDASKP